MNAPRLLDRLQRLRLARRRSLDWWLIYGPVRSGTTFMLDLVAASARLRVGDWGLRPALGLPPDLPHVRFDRHRARADLSRNVLLNAAGGGGTRLDLAYKSAQLRPDEHRALVEMWGRPTRTIFCIREPSSYLASAVRKFPEFEVEAFRREYVRDVETHRELGGDVFEYGPDRTLDDYRRFLSPLSLPEGDRYEFSYRGDRADDLVTGAMVAAYESVVGSGGGSIRSGAHQ